MWRLGTALLLAVATVEPSGAPITFAHRASGFTLENGETPERHAPETMAGGVAVFDYDNDGDLDLFFTNGAEIATLRKTSRKYSNRLFANDGKGNFTDVTEKAGLTGTGFDVGVAIADYDNDGYKDIFVGGVHHVTLYHNNRDGTFTDVTAKAGLSSTDPEFGPLWSVGGAWLDVNNDGLQDLFVVNYLAWDAKTEPPCEGQGRREYCHPKFYKKLPNQLYLNLGGGAFKDVSGEAGIRVHPGKGMGIGIADYDHDGLMDVFIANDKAYNSLFHNKGATKFEEVALKAGVSLIDSGEFISGMGVDFRDLDDDGFADIAVVALDDETFPLFHNNGKGEFVDVTSASKLGVLSLPMAGYSPSIFDFDNDGRKDLFVTRGHVQSLQAAPRIKVEQHNTVFRNLGGLQFTAFTAEAGLTVQPPRRHRGSAVGDLNGDGLVDVVVTALGAPAEIWMNTSPGGAQWLELQLEGTRSNRDAIGASIKVVTKSGTQYNHVTTAVGYASSSAGPVHFGLGREWIVDELEIRWPSGRVQTLRSVATGQVLKVREPQD